MSRHSSIVNWVAEVDASGNVHRLERVDAFDPAAATAPTPAAPESQARLVPASLRSAEDQPEPEAPPPSTEQAAAAVPATLAGCLERDQDTFWLKNVSGDDAPKSRSWKSGFLRKKSPPVELVDGGSTNRLTAYVGRRIETTGALVDREMRVKTLRVLGSCE